MSGANGDCPRLIRRTKANSRSTNGIARTATGMSSGSASGKDPNALLNTCGSVLVVAVVAAADSMRPTSIDPESPMKIRAGEKLCGRKPMHVPARAAVSNVGTAATSR